ncbi:MAG: hypothetical protein M3Y50_15540 [Acidobacteriota bacterium]|nr:hypothetical protein [Acidobacteriota bacterium]
MPLPPRIPEPRDQKFRGTIELHVDATDTFHSLFRVSETVPIQSSGEMVLLYPEWETTSHSPTVSAIELAGLRAKIDGHDIEWRRDTIDIHAFRLTIPAGSHSLTLDFQYLPSRSSAKLRPEMVDVEWQHLLLYPAGWFTRDIPVVAQLELPKGLRAFTALTGLPILDSSAYFLAFAPETLDRLVDAPVYAARYTRQLDLTSSFHVPVHLDLLADEPADLDVSPTDLGELQALVVQASKVFGAPPFRHYDALVSLSDQLSPGGGLEHLDEGENNLPANYFTASGKQLNNRDLIAHEYIHAWNGRFRQPAGLWSPTFNRPTDPSMLWVYEGQTECGAACSRPVPACARRNRLWIDLRATPHWPTHAVAARRRRSPTVHATFSTCPDTQLLGATGNAERITTRKVFCYGSMLTRVCANSVKTR